MPHSRTYNGYAPAAPNWIKSGKERSKRLLRRNRGTDMIGDIVAALIIFFWVIPALLWLAGWCLVLVFEHPKAALVLAVIAGIIIWSH
jgi:hypothetical protein